MLRSARIARTFLALWPLLVAPLSAQEAVELPARDTPLRPALTDLFRVGKIEGASWEMFGSRVETGFDAAGNLHVFDPENHRVVVVSRSGAFVRQIGKAGDGPGELRSPLTFTVMRDGTVVIADMGHRSLLIFGADGEYRNAVPLGSDVLLIPSALLPDPRGGAVLMSGRKIPLAPQSLDFTPDGRLATPLAAAPRGRPILRYGLDGASEPAEVYVGWQADPPAPSTTGSAAQGSFMVARAVRAFEPELLMGVLPDGSLVVSDSSAYALDVVAPDGSLRRVLRRPLRPQPVTPAIERGERERRRAELESGAPPVRIAYGGSGSDGRADMAAAAVQEMARRNADQVEFYPEVPVLASLRTGWTGKLWLGRRASGGGLQGPVDVLGVGGEYLGTISGEDRRMPQAFGPEGLAAFVERDEFDVVSVAVRRLPAELR